MPETMAVGIERLVQEIVNSGAAPDAAMREQIAQELAKRFHVQPDEVAILALVHNRQLLRFVLPEKLRPVGTIPLNSTSALATRTARDQRAEVLNNFPAVRHASVFEGVPLGREQGEMIQKIMSVPIILEKRVLGVVQVCRKGHTPGDAGPDFSTTDLKDLFSLSAPLAKFLLASQES